MDVVASLVHTPPGRRISTDPEVIPDAGPAWMWETVKLIDDVPSGTTPVRSVGSVTEVCSSGRTVQPLPSEQVHVGGTAPPRPAAETNVMSDVVLTDCSARDGPRLTSSRTRYVPGAAGTLVTPSPVSLLSEINE